MTRKTKKSVKTTQAKLEKNADKPYIFLEEHVEYREAIGLWKQWAQFRRQGLVFVTAAVAGVIAANSANIALANIPGWTLPAMGMLFASIGFLNEYFLFEEMMGFKRRAFQLEVECGYKMISEHTTSVHPVWLFVTQWIFRFYYLVWLVAFSVQLYLVLCGGEKCQIQIMLL